MFAVEGGTAIPTHVYINLGFGNYLCSPICRCYITEPNTAGTIYCPLHGEMYKINGVVEPINRKNIECQLR